MPELETTFEEDIGVYRKLRSDPENTNKKLYPNLLPKQGLDKHQMVDQIVVLLKASQWFSDITESDIEKFREVYKFADEAHGQSETPMRKNGVDETITHSLGVDILLVGAGLIHLDLLNTGTVHDVKEDTDRTLDDIEQVAGKRVRDLVNFLSNVKSLSSASARSKNPPLPQGMTEDDQLSIEKIFSALLQDPYASYGKTADVSYNSESLDALKPEKQGPKAMIYFQYFYPLAAGLGLGYAEAIPDNALMILQPKIARSIQERRDKINTRGRLRRLQDIVNTWTEKGFGENPQLSPIAPYTSIGIEVPTIYEIYQKRSKKGGIEETDFLPSIKIICPGNDSLLQWYASFRSEYGLTEEELCTNPFEPIDEYGVLREPIVKRIPFNLGSQQKYIEVRLSTAESEIMPVHLDTAGADLSVREREIAIRKLDRLIESYKQSFRERKGVVKSPSRIYGEMLLRGTFEVQDRDEVEHQIPNDATLLDFAYLLGPWLGNDSVGATIIRNGIKFHTSDLSQPIEPNDKVYFDTAHPSLPGRYDLVNTISSRSQIAEYIERSKSDPEVINAARHRGIDILLWLYKQKNGRDLDIHLDYAFDEDFQNLYNQFDDFKEKLGYVELPMREDAYTQWIDTAQENTLLANAISFVDKITEIRRNKWGMRIYLGDKTGRLRDFGAITSMLDINVLPFSALPDHHGRGNKPIFIEAMYTDAEESRVLTLQQLMGGLIPDVRVEIIRPTKEQEKIIYQG